MKKLLLPLLFVPLMFGVSSKNTVKTEAIIEKAPSFAMKIAPTDAQSFIKYWNEEFRVMCPAVCDITREQYNSMYANYSPLSSEDKAVVNAAKDAKEPDYTIGEIIKSLINKYYPNNNKVKESKQKLDQSSIIVIASVVALVGATAISVLFILKNNKVIK